METFHTGCQPSYRKYVNKQEHLTFSYITVNLITAYVTVTEDSAQVLCNMVLRI